MVLLACLVAAAFLLAATALGRAIVEWVTPGDAARDRPFLSASAPLIGFGAILGLLDLVALVLPMRIGAFAVVPVIVGAAYLLFRRRAPVAGLSGDAIALGVGIVAAAVPLFIVDRVTVVALTNDDATYYLAAADQILVDRWLDDPPKVTTLSCLSNLILHAWLWRTGVPNALAMIVTLARVTPTAAVAILTMLLTALVAPAAIAIGLALGMPDRPRDRALVGSLVVLSAVTIFLSRQHLLGQLLASSFFPLGLFALGRAVKHGGAHRMLVAAILLGAGMNGFADAAVALILASLSTLAFGGKRGPVRLAGTGALSLVLFAPTAHRAAWAAWGTVVVRPKEEPGGIFPQRGWILRGPLDDAATLVGVDPWPPWPAPWPSSATLLERAATLAAIVLVAALVFRHRKERGVVACALLSLATVLAVVFGIGNAYLRAKWLLLDAAILVPIVVAAAVVLSRRWSWAALGLFFSANVLAVVLLSRVSAFHVVDEPDHDRLVQELARVPRGSLFVLDGFGAPADTVHDEHRAYRAAHAAGLEPAQPGLDGGFYKPVCGAPVVAKIPAVGWALQRQGSETISGGEIVAHFGRFTLRRAELAHDFVGAWAPTHGFLRAEVEPDGTVFRWGERRVAGTLQVFSSARCGRFVAEVRTVSSSGTWVALSGDRPLGQGAVTPTWSPLRTAVFVADQPIPIELQTTAASPDPEHVIAMRKVAFVPEPSCISTSSATLPEPLREKNEYTLAPASGLLCGAAVVSFESKSGGDVEIDVGGDHVSSALPVGHGEARSLPFDFRRNTKIAVRPVAGASGIEVVGLRIQPTPCEDSKK
ncbi:MAG: hypothetical protein ACXVEE_07335 [Polyangiales bacterium]